MAENKSATEVITPINGVITPMGPSKPTCLEVLWQITWFLGGQILYVSWFWGANMAYKWAFFSASPWWTGRIHKLHRTPTQVPTIGKTGKLDRKDPPLKGEEGHGKSV